MSQDRFSIEESIQESLSFSHSLAKVAERARKMQKKQQPNIQSASYIEEDDFENKDDEVESGSIIEEIIGDSQIKSSIHISNTLGSSRAQKQSRHQSNSYGFGKDSSVNTYDQSILKFLNQLEEKNDFIDKKFNKLRKDIQYGPLSSIQNRMKTVQNKQLIDKIHQNQKQQQLNHEHYANKPCNFCENVLLKDLRFPQSKVDKLYMEEFLKMKYLKLVKDEGDEQREQMRQELKEYATEIERKEVINRKFFQLKQKQIYGDDSNELDFNYSQK